MAWEIEWAGMNDNLPDEKMWKPPKYKGVFKRQERVMEKSREAANVSTLLLTICQEKLNLTCEFPNSMTSLSITEEKRKKEFDTSYS